MEQKKDNANAPDNYECTTPIHWAAYRGHTEIVKILAPLSENPDAPNRNRKTPSSVSRTSEIRKFLKSFNTSRKLKAGSSMKPSKKRAKKF